MRATVSFGILFGTAMVIAGGCVSQDRYDTIQTAHRTLTEENIILSDKLESQEANTRLLQQRLENASAQMEQVEAQNKQLLGEVGVMQGNYATLEKQLNSMEFILPAEVNVQLVQFAEQYPGLLSYDQQRGMVQFASDLTFDLGSAQLKPQAQESLQKLAGILNDALIAKYEVKIVGHTDSVPIVNPGTRENHPTNMHLSVHRAISVADALTSANIDPRRIEVAGYGPHRPIVAEGPGGAAQNRRVEIYLVRMTAPIDDAPAADAPSAADAAEDTIEPNK